MSEENVEIDVDTVKTYEAHVQHLDVLLTAWVDAMTAIHSSHDEPVMDALRHKVKLMLADESYEKMMKTNAVAYMICTGDIDETA